MVQYPLSSLPERFHIAGFAPRRGHAEGENMGRVEAGGNTPELPKAAEVDSLLCAKGASIGLGDHKSTSRSGKRKDAGIRPTIWTDHWPIRSCFPRALGSAPKRRRQ